VKLWNKEKFFAPEGNILPTMIGKYTEPCGSRGTRGMFVFCFCVALELE
jgi:hypothetical protein